MKKAKIFIACDTTSVNKVKRIIRLSSNSQIDFGYKFGLEFLNSKKTSLFVKNAYGLDERIIEYKWIFNELKNNISLIAEILQGYRIDIFIDDGDPQDIPTFRTLDVFKNLFCICRNRI